MYGRSMAYTKTRRLFLYSIGLSFAIFLCTSSYSQSRIDSVLNKLDPQRFATSIKQKAEKLEKKLLAKSMKVLEKMQNQEEKLYRKMLSTKDSLQTKAELAGINGKYKALRDKLKNPALSGAAKQYIPHLDSLTTALSFLDKDGIAGNIKDALAKTKSLQDKFQQAEEIKKFISERKEQLKQQFEKLGMVKQLKQINKQVFYFFAQVKEYKEILKDSKKIEKKALELLSKTKWYQEFFKKNSMLASLFRMPGDPNDPAYTANLAGLQTRVQVNNLIQEQIASGGPNARQQFQQNIQAAQSQLQQLKDKVLKFGGGSSGDVMPEGFKPNSERTKSLWKRFEIGTNIQNQKSNGLLPTTSDIGLFLGFKANDRSVVGVGTSFKLGWGQDIRHIKLSGQGLSLRSFVDIKLKGSFWISGAYEMNYRSAFRNIASLQQYADWQQSCLIGISKTV